MVWSRLRGVCQWEGRNSHKIGVGRGKKLSGQYILIDYHLVDPAMAWHERNTLNKLVTLLILVTTLIADSQNRVYSHQRTNKVEWTPGRRGLNNAFFLSNVFLSRVLSHTVYNTQEYSSNYNSLVWTKKSLFLSDFPRFFIVVMFYHCFLKKD